jgi:hypothetical protein
MWLQPVAPSGAFAYRLGVHRDAVPCRGNDAGTVTYFLVEIPVQHADGADLDRALRTLRAAEARLTAGSAAAHPLLAGAATENGRLVFLIEAVTLEGVRSLVSLALLPAGRIREAPSLAGLPFWPHRAQTPPVQAGG